jgi:5'-nucleotidase
MPYDLSKKLVIGVASSALFDLSESDAVFRLEGVDAYRRYQEENISNTLAPGVAFPFIKRLLALNLALVSHAPSGVVEVIVLSRNDPDTGLRVMRSLEAHGLDMTRAVFCEGKAPFDYMGLPRGLVTPDLACLGGRPERMSTCPSHIPVSSATTSFV